MNSDYDPLQGYVEEPSSDPRFRVFRRPRGGSSKALRGCAFVSFIVVVVVILIVSTTLTLNDPVGTKVEIPDDSPGLRSILRLSYPIKGEWENLEKRRMKNSGRQWEKLSGEQVVIEESLRTARIEVEERKILEDRLVKDNNKTKSNPSMYHQRATAWTPEVKDLADDALVVEKTTQDLVKNDVITKDDVKLGSALPTPIKNNVSYCQMNRNRPCNTTAIYRTPDGSCNNLKHPLWGAAKVSFRRALPAKYDDGLSSARLQSRGGQDLPSPRLISVNLASEGELKGRTLPNLTHMFLTWGQFLDHDITATAPTKGRNGEGILCCHKLEKHPECLPISIPENDSIMRSNGVSCMEFIRSAPALTCSVGPREQMNLITSYIDASQVYHSDRLEARWLRTMYTGYLRVRFSPDGRPMLPISPDPQDGCNKPEEMQKSRYCFKAGDLRVNEQVTLTSMHLLWMREHNRIAHSLSELNPAWSDEKLYQESRKIVIAEIQHITYNEFLPILLGSNVVDYLELRPQKRGYFYNYNEDVDATVANEFATAAYRFGHSMLQGLVQLQGPSGRNVDFVQLHKLLFNPFQHWDTGFLDSLMRGQVLQHPRPVSVSFNDQVRNHLFESKQGHVGLDLLSLNIQRGRDHGLQSYTEWRVVCGLTSVSDFAGLNEEIVPENIEMLKKVYRDVSDIDLYVGIVAETPIQGALVGPTAACLIADQFLRLRNGDRFWYETPERGLRFTEGQLDEIRKTTLARVICENADAMDYMPLDVFRPHGPNNQLTSCTSGFLPKLDLSPWDDEDSDSLLPLFVPDEPKPIPFSEHRPNINQLLPLNDTATPKPIPFSEHIPNINQLLPNNETNSIMAKTTTLNPALVEVFEVLEDFPAENTNKSTPN